MPNGISIIFGSAMLGNLLAAIPFLSFLNIFALGGGEGSWMQSAEVKRVARCVVPAEAEGNLEGSLKWSKIACPCGVYRSTIAEGDRSQSSSQSFFLDRAMAMVQLANCARYFWQARC